MDPVLNLDQVVERLEQGWLDPWGPAGVRYICFLFWDYRGYRHLTNQIDRETWETWHRTSGQFWDLFLAGCYPALPSSPGSDGLPLFPRSQGRGTIVWNPDVSVGLEHEIGAEAMQAGARPWTFSGPLELVAVGARRYGREVAFDWASLRSASIEANALGAAVSEYTEAHISMDTDIVPDDLPVPGDFEDRLPGEIWRDLVKHVGLLKFLFRH